MGNARTRWSGWRRISRCRSQLAQRALDGFLAARPASRAERTSGLRVAGLLDAARPFNPSRRAGGAQLPDPGPKVRPSRHGHSAQPIAGSMSRFSGIAKPAMARSSASALCAAWVSCSRIAGSRAGSGGRCAADRARRFSWQARLTCTRFILVVRRAAAWPLWWSFWRKFWLTSSS